MKNTNRCPKCNSVSIIPNVRIADRTDSGHQDLKIQIFGDPKALLFKKSELFVVRAWICGECGFIEQHLADPRKAFHHYMEYGKPDQDPDNEQ